MSYGLAAAFQTALYARLSSADELAALIGDAVYDGTPVEAVPETYVTFGAETVRDKSDAETAGALHDFSVSVISTANGFLSAKKVAAAVYRALDVIPLELSGGRVVWLRFQKARAQRTTVCRQIDLRFRAHVVEE